MKFLFTKVSLVCLSLYAVLCIQGVLIAPKDFWAVAACVPILFIIQLEGQ